MSIKVCDGTTWIDFQVNNLEIILAKFKKNPTELNMIRLRAHMRDLSRTFNEHLKESA